MILLYGVEKVMLAGMAGPYLTPRYQRGREMGFPRGLKREKIKSDYARSGIANC